MDVSAFANRLKKNHARLAKTFERQKTNAWRVYDQDIPEFRYTVDRYGPQVVFTEYQRLASTAAQVAAVKAATQDVLQVPPGHLHHRTRTSHVWGKTQYERLSQDSVTQEVQEAGLRFLVNLTDFLDVGLFMDHRQTRARVGRESAGKRMLNLFCYTGSFTVYAAAGEARSTVSVDHSGNYLEWAEDNLRLNGLNHAQHQRVRADVLTWVKQQPAASADLIVLDPPSYSSGGKMEGTFEIQRDHVGLIKDVTRLLAPGGVLYFSTNFTTFQLDPLALAGAAVQELTPQSLPPDFRVTRAHRCWRAQLPG